MKEARVVLLHKGGNKDAVEPGSFRPINVINSAGKLMKRLILQRLEIHLDSVPNGKSQEQYGFKKGRSTIDALERVLEVSKSLTEGHHNIGT